MEEDGREGGLYLIASCNPDYTLHLLELYNYTYTISSMVTLVLTAVILAAMVFYKAYHTPLQRMCIYLTLTIMVFFSTSSLSIQLQPSIFKHTGNTLCQWTGYIQVCANTSSLVLSLEISIYLLYMMWHQMRGKPLPVPTRSQTLVLELTGLFVGVVIPPCLLATGIEHYGVGGAICWIQIYTNSSCNDTRGLDTLGVAVFSVYTIITSIDLIAYTVLVAIFFWLGCKFQQSRTRYMKTAKRTAILALLLVSFTVVQLVSILVVYFMLKKDLGLKKSEFVFCILTPLSQLIRPLAYVFYLNSIKKFRWKVAKSAAGEWRDSWRVCCLHLRHWMAGKKGRLFINNLDARSSEYLTPSLVTSSNYEGLSPVTPHDST